MKAWLIPCVASGMLALGAETARAQYYSVQSYAYPTVSYYAPAPLYYSPGAYYYATVPNNRLYAGNNFAFYGQATTSYYPPTFSAYGTQALGYETTPSRAPILFVQPGPYYYTPAQSYTPNYYDFYSTPHYFRY